MAEQADYEKPRHTTAPGSAPTLPGGSEGLSDLRLCTVRRNGGAVDSRWMQSSDVPRRWILQFCSSPKWCEVRAPDSVGVAQQAPMGLPHQGYPRTTRGTAAYLRARIRHGPFAAAGSVIEHQRGGAHSLRNRRLGTGRRPSPRNAPPVPTRRAHTSGRRRADPPARPAMAGGPRPARNRKPTGPARNRSASAASTTGSAPPRAAGSHCRPSRPSQRATRARQGRR